MNITKAQIQPLTLSTFYNNFEIKSKDNNMMNIIDSCLFYVNSEMKKPSRAKSFRY